MLYGGYPKQEEGWFDVTSHLGGHTPADAALAAVQLGSQASRLEYQCRDYGGRPQGYAVVKALEWESCGKALVRVDREAVSDGYYGWYIQNQCKDGVVLHVCAGRPCRARLEQGDRRELIHACRALASAFRGPGPGAGLHGRAGGPMGPRRRPRVEKGAEAPGMEREIKEARDMTRGARPTRRPRAVRPDWAWNLRQGCCRPLGLRHCRCGLESWSMCCSSGGAASATWRRFSKRS